MEHTAKKTRELVLASLLTAATAVLAQIMLSIGPVPFNLAVLGAYLAGCLLEPVWALASMAAYLLLGAFGLPVFAGFSGGPAILAGPTGGYIVGYLLIALFTALAAKHGKNPLWTAAAMAAGLLACYALGTGWFMIVTGRSLPESLALCVLPFVIPDTCKAAAALLLSRAVRARLRR